MNELSLRKDKFVSVWTYLSPWVHHGSGHESSHTAPDDSSADGTQPQIEGTFFTSYQVATRDKHNRHIFVHAHFACPLLLQAAELFFCAQLRLVFTKRRKNKKQKPKLLVLSQLQSASCDSLGSHTATCPLFCSETVKVAEVSLRQISFKLKSYSYCRLAYPHKIHLTYTCELSRDTDQQHLLWYINYPHNWIF